MNRSYRNVLGVILLAVAMTVIVACDDKDAQQTKQSSTEPAAAQADGPAEALPAELILDKSPDGAQDVVTVKKAAKAGDTVTIRGRVGGSEKPLADNRAIVTLIDLTLPTCEKSAMDTCPTPWDACCEPSEEITAKSATIQVVGPDGRPLKATLAGVSGIAPLKELIVTGKVRTPADSGALVVDATGIYVKG
jgi:hypothetical protein